MTESTRRASAARNVPPRRRTEPIPGPCLFAPDDRNRLRPVADGKATADCAFTSPERGAAWGALRGFISDPRYPCAGAKSALRLGAVRLGFYPALASGEAMRRSAADAAWFAGHVDEIDGHFATLIAIFHGPPAPDEASFADAFWAHLSGMVREDRQRYEPDPAVSDDPSSADFALSLGDKAFFVVAMHPAASRVARRSPVTALVLNLHEQFDALREAERFDAMRDTIRSRDARLQGKANPMLDDHGSSSGALQYDGRTHDSDWVPPLQPQGSCPQEVSDSDTACPSATDVPK